MQGRIARISRQGRVTGRNSVRDAPRARQQGAEIQRSTCMVRCELEDSLVAMQRRRKIVHRRKDHRRIEQRHRIARRETQGAFAGLQRTLQQPELKAKRRDGAPCLDALRSAPDDLLERVQRSLALSRSMQVLAQRKKAGDISCTSRRRQVSELIFQRCIVVRLDFGSPDTRTVPEY